MNENEMRAFLQKVKGNLRVTKVVATRSVKGQRGDHFAGFAACYDSVQDEPSGAGKDLIASLEDEAVATSGMSLKEAKIAYYLVAQQADVAAHEAALANGSIGSQEASDRIRSIKNNYGKLIRLALQDKVPADPAEAPAK